MFFTVFHHFPPFSHCVLTIFLHFPWFFLPFSFRFQGTWGESNPTVTKLPSGSCPPKKFNWPPLSPPDIKISVHLGNLPSTPPILTSFAKTTLPSLSAGFRNIQEICIIRSTFPLEVKQNKSFCMQRMMLQDHMTCCKFGEWLVARLQRFL